MVSSMKTTLDIPNKHKKAWLKATKAKTKTAAISKAIEEYIYQEKVKKGVALELNEVDLNYPAQWYNWLIPLSGWILPIRRAKSN